MKEKKSTWRLLARVFMGAYYNGGMHKDLVVFNFTFASRHSALEQARVSAEHLRSTGWVEIDNKLYLAPHVLYFHVEEVH